MMMPVFLVGFILGVLFVVLCALCAGVEDGHHEKLLRKILAHLDPKDPDAEP